MWLSLVLFSYKIFDYISYWWYNIRVKFCVLVGVYMNELKEKESV